MRVSIIIPVYNQIEYTRKCIESIKKNTSNTDYEIIVIDNASEDGTGDFFKKQDVVYIYNNENKGVAKAWNQGIKQAKGDYVCIINNDIIVCKNWLSEFIRIYESMKNIGILSPGTKEGELNYDFESYSENFIKKMKNIKEKGFAGWCMFIKKERFDEIGLFSEEFNIGIGEDTDFYFRLKEKGYESYITGAVFVHHFGSKTLKDIKELIGDKFEKENIKKLNEKWKLKESYIIKKLKNLKKLLKNFYIKLFYGYNLIQK